MLWCWTVSARKTWQSLADHGDCSHVSYFHALTMDLSSLPPLRPTPKVLFLDWHLFGLSETYEHSLHNAAADMGKTGLQEEKLVYRRF